METVTISPKSQAVIPKRIREGLGLHPGQKVQAIQYGDRVELVPVKSARLSARLSARHRHRRAARGRPPVNVVDSCGWLEYFAAGPNADFFAPALEAPAELVVPTISVHEVFKRVLQQRGESDALQAVALMQQGVVVDLTAPIALEAARTSAALGMPMADSLMLATARSFEAALWTQNSDFEGVEGVRCAAAQSS